MQRLTFAQRNQALWLLAGGARQTEVARRFNVTALKISSLVTREKAAGTTVDHPRPGQPRVTSTATSLTQQICDGSVYCKCHGW